MKRTGGSPRSRRVTNQQDDKPDEMIDDSPSARLRPLFATMDNEIDMATVKSRPFQRSSERTDQMTKRTSTTTTNKKSTQSHNDADDKETTAHKQPDRTKSVRSTNQSNANNEGSQGVSLSLNGQRRGQDGQPRLASGDLQQQRRQRDQKQPTENNLNDNNQCKLASLRKHRRRDSMSAAQARTPGSLLWQLANHVIFVALLALLLLGPNFSPRQQRYAAVEALKLPAFLSSWIPQAAQQQQQQLQQQQQQEEPLVASDSHLVAFADQQQLLAGGASASNSELPTQTSSANVQPQRQRNANSLSGNSLKRPFQSMLSVGGKHSTGGHLFSVLPRSLFGRILGQQQTSTTPSLLAKQQQQQLLMMGNKYIASNSNTPMWPFGHQQQLGLNQASSMLPSGQFHGHDQQQQQQLNYNKQLATFSPLISNQQMNFGGGGGGDDDDVQQASQSLRQQNANFVTSLLPTNEHPITSFRPTVNANSISLPRGNATTITSTSQREQQLASEKKHALGYGENDDDFVIVNAQQVPELQQQQADGPHPTRHPSDEYREMPAIVIADPEMLGPSESSRPNVPFNRSEYQRPNVSLAFESGGSQQQQEFIGDLAKLTLLSSELATSNKTADGANGTLATTRQKLNQSAQLVSLASTNSSSELSISKATRNVTSPTEEHPELDKKNATLPFEQLAQSASSQLQLSDSPESNRQESAAQATVVVPSNGIEQQQQQQTGLSQQQQEHQEQMESFIIGPYKGLTLGPDEPNLVQSHSQIQFINHDQPLGNFMASSGYGPQMIHHKQQQQQSPSASHNLIGSASSLLQQARQLIQLPFTHLPHNVQLHQQQRPLANNFGHLQTASQQMVSTTNSRPFARPPPRNYWHQQQNMMMAQRQQQQQQQHQPHYFPGGPLHQASMNRPQHNIKLAHQLRPFGMMSSVGQSQQAAYFMGEVEQMPRPNFGAHRTNPVQSPQMFGTAIGNNQQMMPQGAQYFMEAQQQQQVRHQAPLSYEQARQLDTVGDFSQMLANLTSGQSQVKRAPKSGLYQIEPPKLEQTKLSGDGDETQQQQQQKIEVQENSNELGEDSNNESDDDDDDDEDSPQQQQQQQQERVPQDEQQQQSRSVSEPILASNQSAQPSNQILQVGASFGVVAATTNGSSSVANQAHERRGQVFNEPLGQHGTGSQQAAVQPQQNAVAYDLAHQSQPSSGRNFLDTQVYTLPYTVSMHQNAQQDEATFVPQPQVPRYMYPEVRLPNSVPQVANWQQQQQQQMPITFITTSSQESQQQQMRPRQGQASWSSFKRPFGQRPPQTRMMQQSSRPPNQAGQAYEQQQFNYAAASSQLPQIKQQQQYFHYQPIAMDLNNNAIQQQQQQHQQQQFAFALQHQPSGNELQMRQLPPQQPQVLVAENTTGSQDASTTTAALSPSGSQAVEVGKAQDSVSEEPTTSDSTTTPSTIIVDASQEGDLNQQQEQSHDSDRKSAQEQQQSKDQNSIDDDQQAGQRKLSVSQSRQQAQQQQARSPSGFCAGRTPGLYADTEQRCKAYYQCAPTGHQMFRCNNQTQFNQKTQNCDWWYNVDCGGRLGSPEDFEQAASSPRTRVASQMSDFVQVTPMTPLTTTTTTATLISTSPVTSGSAESQQQLSRSEGQDQLRSFVEPPTSSTRAFYTTTMTSTSTSTSPMVLQNSSSASPNGEQEFSSQTQFSDRNSSLTTPQTTTAATNNSFDHQQDASDQHSSTGFSSTSSTPTVSSANTLIEPAASNSVESQPRVGASPNDETTTTIAAANSPSSSATPQQLDGDDESNSRQQPANEPQTKSRRLIQSEFGGSSKTARAISSRNAAEAAKQQQQRSATEDELSLIMSSESSQAHAQEHQSIRLSSGLASTPTEVKNHQYQLTDQQQPGTNQDQVIYATSNNQGSISYDPQSLPLQQQLQKSLESSELPTMTTPSSTVSQSNNNKDESTSTSRTGKMERRFGARLPPNKKP